NLIAYLSDPQNLNSYSYAKNNPLKYSDPSGNDATITINDKAKTVTVNLNIYIYGRDATSAVAAQMKADIMAAWSKPWTFSDNRGVYTTQINVSVEVTQCSICHMFGSSNNLIKIDNSVRSYVNSSGYKGTWRGNAPDPAPHETGHLLGLNDRY